MNFKIRKALSKDQKDIERIHVETMQEIYQGILDESYLQSFTKEQFCWEGRLKHNEKTYHVAELDGKIVGIIGAGEPKNEELFPKCDSELYLFYVDVDYQGKGIGSRMFDFILKSLSGRGFTNMYVQVFKENTFKNFYIKKGGRYLGNVEELIGGKKVLIEFYGFIL